MSRAFQLRAGRLIERPAFAALAAVDLRRAVQVLALAHVEAGEMAARGERRPDDAVAVDVHAARIEAGLRHLEDLRLAGRRRVVAALQPDQEAGVLLADAPHRVVDRTRNHRVHAVGDHACRASDRTAVVSRAAAPRRGRVAEIERRVADASRRSTACVILPSPFVSSTWPHQPLAFCSSCVWSYTFVSIQPKIGPISSLKYTVSSASLSNCR